MGDLLLYLALRTLDAVVNEDHRTVGEIWRDIESREQRDEMRRAHSSPLAGWLILLDNEWEHCAIDGIRAVADWETNATEESLLGLDRICPGRHLVQTVLPSGVARLDVLLYPGDMLAFRLDQERAAWEPVSGEERALLVAAINEGQLEFHNYYERVAEQRIAGGEALPTKQVLNELPAGITSLLRRLDAGEPASRLAPDVQRIIGALVGLPFPSFDSLGRQIAAQAWERAAAGRRDLAELVTHLGLALLPGESSLLACQARLAAADQRWDEALALAAQARPHADAAVRAWLDDIRQRSPYR